MSKKYDEAVGRLNGLIDEVGTDEHHPLYSLLDKLGTVIHAYEDKHYPMPKCRGGDSLQFLMDEHSLTQLRVTRGRISRSGFGDHSRET